MIKDVVFMGTPDFAVGTLQALVDSGRYRVSAVFTQPDKPRGRGKALQMSPVKEAALQAGIPIFQPRRIREEESCEILRKLSPDVIVVVAFGQLIPEQILNLPEYGCINVHASLLPRYRGAAPIQWAVLDGEKESGVTTMRMDAGLDTGDMIKKTVVRLEDQETGGSLFEKLSAAGAKLLIETLDAINDGTAVYEKQPAQSPTRYASMLTKEMGRIDWSKSAREIDCLIRGMNPWPSAYTTYRGKLLKLWMAEEDTSGGDGKPGEGESAQSFPETEKPVPGIRKDGEAQSLSETEEPVPGAGKSEGTQNVPGTAEEVTKKSLKIRTGDGLLTVLEVQPEGKKRMPVEAFLRGYPVNPGERFG